MNKLSPKPFDIVLVNTHTPLAFLQRLVYKIQNHPTHISHVGIMYSNTLIFEAHTHLRIIPISKLNINDIALLRIKACNNIDIESFKILCEQLYGMEYDYLQLINDLYYLFTDKAMGSRQKFVCSELVAYIIKQICGDIIYKELFGDIDTRIVMPYHFATLKKHNNVELIYQGKNFKW